MIRPAYESPKDREHERDLAARVADAWRCKLHKLPHRYEFDYTLERAGVVFGFAELKRRTHARGDFETYMIALSKWRAGLDLSRTTNRRAILVVEFTDGAAWTAIEPGPMRVAIGGRRDRKDWQDVEPVVLVPIEKFQPLEPLEVYS